MLRKLTEAILLEEETKLATNQLADGVVVANCTPIYKRLSGIPEGEKLEGDEKQEFIDTLNTVQIPEGATKQEQLQAVITAVK